MFLLNSVSSKATLGYVIVILAFMLIIVVSSIVKYYRNRKYLIYRAFYKWVFNKYGEDKVVKFYKVPDEYKNKGANGSFVDYDGVVMKYDGGEAKTILEATFIQDPELGWIKKQKEGINAKVLNEYVYFEIPEQDVSNINLTKAYGSIKNIVKLWIGVIFGKTAKPIKEDLIRYTNEFKSTEEYKNILKQKRL